MKNGKREWPMAITAADRAAGLRSIARCGNLWPEAVEEILEAANLLDGLKETQ